MSIRLQLFKMLNEGYDYAVLRNFEGLPDFELTRDIDIVIRRRDYSSVENDVLGIVRECGYYLLIRFESERFNTLIIANAENKDIVQLDFFFHTSARGIILITAEELLGSRCFNGHVYHVSKKYQFLDKFMFNIAVGRAYPGKYAALKEWAQDDEETLKFIKDHIGCDSIKDVEELTVCRFRMKLFIYSLKRAPIKQVWNYVAFLASNVKNMMFPQGFAIGVTGPDGVGKTTVMNIVEETLSSVVCGVTQFHFRPDILNNLSDTMHSVGLKKEVDHDYSKPHRGKETGKISSMCRLFYYTIDYILGYAIKVRPILYRRGIVIFDRYFTDVIVDSRRSKINLEMNFLVKYSKFVPRLRYNILLTANPDSILQRKQELSRDAIADIVSKMNMLAKKSGYFIIGNDGSPEMAATEILEVIYKNQDKRYGV